MPAPPRIWRPCGRGAGRAARSSRATQLPARDVRRQGRFACEAFEWAWEPNQPATGSPSAPVSNANEALGRARESSAQNEKIAKENFSQKSY